jgi:hypothetical protein
MMDDSLLEGRSRTLRTLRTRRRVLEAEVLRLDAGFAGLKDIDAVLELVSAGLALGCELLDAAARSDGSDAEAAAALRAEAREETRAALGRFEELCAANISLDQEDAVRRAPGYAEVRRRSEQLLLAGGAILLEDRVEDRRRARRVARALAGSVRKYLAPEKGEPYGIGEGEERTCCAARMTLPLSQAVHYLEKELLPELLGELAAAPGDVALQAQAGAARERLDRYRRLDLSPRARPLLLEKGYYTRGLTGYTAEGELLVTLGIPVRFRSGTNVSRMQELVLAELARRLAGRGVCPGLDAYYEYLRSLESGRRGSSRLPGFRLQTRRALSELKALYPYLARLENRGEFIRCLELVRHSGRRAPQRLLRLLEKAEPPLTRGPFPGLGLPPGSAL